MDRTITAAPKNQQQPTGRVTATNIDGPINLHSQSHNQGNVARPQGYGPNQAPINERTSASDIHRDGHGPQAFRAPLDALRHGLSTNSQYDNIAQHPTISNARRSSRRPPSGVCPLAQPQSPAGSRSYAGTAERQFQGGATAVPPTAREPIPTAAPQRPSPTASQVSTRALPPIGSSGESMSKIPESVGDPFSELPVPGSRTGKRYMSSWRLPLNTKKGDSLS